MWAGLKKLAKLFSDDKGLVTLEYLIMALLIAGVAGLIVAALSSNMADTHDAMVNIITGVTGSGF